MPLVSPWLRFAVCCTAAGLALFASHSGIHAETTAREILLAQADEPAESEGTTEPPPDVEVLRVRGRGLSQIVTDVPSSVTSFDAATIEALGAQDVSDLSRVTPNVSIVQPGSTQATFFIRGIGLSDFSSNAAGAVTIFQDDVAINAPAIQTGQLFDIEGVDIVRGPQGTGHYRNASAGAIRVRSRRPDGNYTAQLRASLGEYRAGGGLGARHALIQEYEGALGVPIAEDLLSARFAFRFRDAEPYKRNDCGNADPIEDRPTRGDARDEGVFGLERVDEFVNICGERGSVYLSQDIDSTSTLPAGLPRWVGDAHNWAARGTFRLTPPESEWDLMLNAHGSRLDQQSTLGQAIGTAQLNQATQNETLGGFGGQVNSLGVLLYAEPDTVEEYRGKDRLSGLCQLSMNRCSNPRAQAQLARNLSRRRPLDIRPYRGDFDLVGGVTRDAYGGYLSAEGKLGEYDLFALASFDAYERSDVADNDFTPEQLIVSDSRDEAWQTYEEVRLAGELSASPFAWELGGYYLFEHLDALVFNQILDGNFDIRREFDQQIHSGALWGSFSWDFLDDFTLEGGVRWNYERKDFDFMVSGTLSNPDPTSQSETWSEPTGELILTWHIDERAQTYARYTRGFKAGHYNSLATARLDTLLADREVIDSWEAGLRGAFWDGRIRGGGAFFYYLYEDFQVFLFSDSPDQPPTLEIVNASEAELYGVEVEGQLRPLEGFVPRWLEELAITGNFSWLKGQYIDFQNDQTFLSGGGFTTVTFDFSGNDLASAPRFKMSGSAEWTLNFGRFGYLIPRYDVSWTDDQFFDPREGQGSIKVTGDASLPKLTIAQPALWLHNVRLGYRTPTGNVELAFWVRNLTDEVYKTFAFDASRFAGLVINFTGEPRTVGFDVVFTF